MSFPSKLSIGSLFVYPSRARQESSREARRFLWSGVKQAEGIIIEAFVGLVKGSASWSILGKLLGDAGALVPVPKHSRHLPGSLWVPERIAEAMRSNGEGSVVPLLERREPVPRSTGVRSASQRPTPTRHRDSLGVTTDLFPPARVMLIDDFVTNGSTLSGCAARLRQVNPKIQIQAFALCRVETWRERNSLGEVLDPKIETFEYDIGWDRPRRTRM